MTLEELLDHFGLKMKVAIFNEKEFVEDMWEEDAIPKDWLKLEVKKWGVCYDNLLYVTI